MINLFLVEHLDLVVSMAFPQWWKHCLMSTFCQADWSKCLFGRRKESLFSTILLRESAALHRWETAVVLSSGEQMAVKTFKSYTFLPVFGQVQLFMPGIVKTSIKN